MAEQNRVAGLDGLRGIAAFYVLLFHTWLLSFQFFPHNTGPRYLTWAMYGRLSVVLFLILSGFSLALSPARRGWQLGGLVRFLRRRAWRILPAYYAALVLSLAVAWLIAPATHKGAPNGRSVAVFGLLLQDIMHSRTPNGAFWSVAVEVELYLLFPLAVVIRRKLGVILLLVVAAGPVIAYGISAPGSNPPEGDTGLTSHLIPVFAAGIAAAGIVNAPPRVRNLPWFWMSAVACAPVVGWIYHRGPWWTGHHFFWIDLAITPGLTMLVIAVATGRAAFLTRLLASRPLHWLGTNSYSLYLIHLPILTVLAKKVAPHHVERGPHTYAFIVLVGAPIAILAAAIFARVFEFPFQRHRSWQELRAAVRGPRPAAPSERKEAYGTRWGRTLPNVLTGPSGLPRRPERTLASEADAGLAAQLAGKNRP